MLVGTPDSSLQTSPPTHTPPRHRPGAVPATAATVTKPWLREVSSTGSVGTVLGSRSFLSLPSTLGTFFVLGMKSCEPTFVTQYGCAASLNVALQVCFTGCAGTICHVGPVKYCPPFLRQTGAPSTGLQSPVRPGFSRLPKYLTHGLVVELEFTLLRGTRLSFDQVIFRAPRGPRMLSKELITFPLTCRFLVSR